MREQRCTRDEKMYSVARALCVCVGKSIAAHHASREKEPPLASQHLVNIRGPPSAYGAVEGRR